MLIFPEIGGRPNATHCVSASMATDGESQRGAIPIVLELLDAWLIRQPGKPSRIEAIERLIALGWAPETVNWVLECERTSLC